MIRFLRDHSRILCTVFLGILILAAYWPTLSGEFILDDKPLIQKNPYITRLHTIVSYLSQEDGKDEGSGVKGPGYYRPLIPLTYWLDYRIWGMNGPGFRLSNLFYHLLVSALFFLLIRRLTGDERVSFCVAALFALHPVNTEAVSWVSSRNNILAALFGIASFLFYLKAKETKRPGYPSLSLLFFTGSLLSKEFGLVLLPVFLLWTFFMGGDRERRASVLIRDHLPYVLILCAFLLLRFWVTGFQGDVAGEVPLWKRMLFTPYLVLVNTQKILVPYELHSFMVHYPRVVSWQSATGILFVAFLGLLLWRERRHRVFRFALLSYVVSLGPILHWVALPSPSLVSMRWLYFPMLFLLAALSPYVKELFRARRSFAVVLILAVGCYLGLLSHMLNRGLWHDEEGFFRQEVFRFQNAYYSGGLAEILHQKRDHRGAEEQFRTAMQTGNCSARDLINYGALLIDTGRAGEALPLLEMAMGLKMGFGERAELYNNLGMAEFRLGNGGEARLQFRKAVAYDPRRALFWSNLGSAYGSAGDYRLAVQAFGRALEMEPDSCPIRKGIAITLMNMQDYEGALIALEGAADSGADCDPEYRALLEACIARIGSGAAASSGADRREKVIP